MTDTGENFNEEFEKNQQGEINEIMEDKEDNIGKEFQEEQENLTNKNEGEKGCLERLFVYLKEGCQCRPIPSIKRTILCLEITGIIFISIGVVILILSNNIKQIEIRYDNNKDCIIGTKCSINFTIEENMKKNVFVYYRLKKFYQNHRRYIKSKSNKQLKGNKMEESSIKSDCEPIILNKDIYEGVMSVDGLTPLDPNGVAHPCGLIAKSFFNDTYVIQKIGEENEISISDKDIAWSIDKDKFKNSPNYTTHQWKDVEDERFIVWMRPAALPDFRKPWGRIERDLNKGNYTLTIQNNYPVKSFDGEKYFILSTVNVLGGKNYFLAILYFVVGGVSVIAGILFIIGYKYYNLEKEKVS